MRFLRLCIMLALLMPWGQTASHAQQMTDINEQDSLVETSSASLNEYRSSTAQQIVLDAVVTDKPFDAIVFHWQIEGNADDIRLAYRTQSNDTWDAWQSLVANEEYRGYDDPDNAYTSTMYSFPVATQAWQISIMSARGTTAYLSSIHANTMSSLDVSPRIDPASMAAPAAAGDKPSIVPRATWGGSTVQAWDARGNACAGDPANCPADATWMPMGSEIGAPTHIVIHHTAGPNYDPATTNWSSIVRNIWQYHAVTNNWGDVGYHFLIDPNGVIYEGRYTGVRDNGTVINGAHAYGFNYASIGISMIGTFSSVQPSAAAQTSLRNMLSWLSAKYNITPGVERPYRPHSSNSNYAKYVSYNGGAGVNLNTIEGHRVTGTIISQIVGQSWGTSCPGDALYAMLPDIRRSVSPIDWIPSVSVDRSTVYTDDVVTFRVTMRNSYTNSSISGSAFTFNDSNYVYSQDQCWAWRDSNGVFPFDRPSASTNPNNRFRMIAGYATWDQTYANTANQCATASTANHPWRWSIGSSSLAPGQQRVVTGKVRFQVPGTYRVYFGLIKDWVGYPDGQCVMGNSYGACGLRTKIIRVLPPPTPTPTSAPAAETVLAAATETAIADNIQLTATQSAVVSTQQADRAQATQQARDGLPTRTITASPTRTATATPITLQQTVNAMRTATRQTILEVASTKKSLQFETATAVSQLRADKKTAVIIARTTRAQQRSDTLATQAAQRTSIIAAKQTVIADHITATAEALQLSPSRTPTLSPTATASRTPIPSRTRIPSSTPTSSRTATATPTLTPTMQALFAASDVTEATIANDPAQLVYTSAGVIVLESNRQSTDDLAHLNVIDPDTLASLQRVAVSGVTASLMSIDESNPDILLVAGKITWNLAFVQRFNLQSGTPQSTGFWVFNTTSEPTALLGTDPFVYVAFNDTTLQTAELRTLYAIPRGFVEYSPPLKLPGALQRIITVDNNATHLIAGGQYANGRGLVVSIENKGRLRLRGSLRINEPITDFDYVPMISKLRPGLILYLASTERIYQATFDITSNRFTVINSNSTNGGVQTWMRTTNPYVVSLRSTTPAQISLARFDEYGYQWIGNTALTPLGYTSAIALTVSPDATYWLSTTAIHRAPYLQP